MKTAILLALCWGVAGAQAPPQRIKVGGNAQQKKLVQQVKPIYPAGAKQAGISGLVRFEATVGKDGRVQSLRVLTGHPALVEAAGDAVKQWVYQPTLLNGEPVDIVTLIDVNFTLADSGNAAYKVGPDIQSARLLRRVEPAYPAEAREKGITGEVRLRILVGPDGRVQQVYVLEGQPELVAAAVDAVKQWEYEPTLVKGEAVAVSSEVSVKLGPPSQN